MLKYFLVATLGFLLMGLGCQDSPPEQTPPQDPMQEQDQMQQQPPAAEADVSDDELQQFVDASMAAQEIQMEAQQEMIAIVEEEGLEVETYNRIAEGQQMGQSQEEMNVSPDDMEKYESASESIAEIEQELEAEFASTIEENGMDMERFQQLNIVIQQDPGLQQRVQEMMQETHMQQQPPQTDSY